MNQRTQVLIFVILAFTALFGMLGWAIREYTLKKGNKKYLNKLHTNISSYLMKKKASKSTPKPVCKTPSITEQYWLEWIGSFNRVATEKQLQEFIGMMEEQIGEGLLSSELLDTLEMKSLEKD